LGSIVSSVRPKGSRRSVAVPPPHAPGGACAVGEKEVLFVQPPRQPNARETWLSFERAGATWTPIAIPWPYRTRRIDFIGARIMAWTTTSDGHPHVLLAKRDDVIGKHDASTWTELVGLPDGEIEVVSKRDDVLLFVVDRSKLVRIGLAPE
jgi:hypothetical protein